MGAFNWIDIEAACPACKAPATLRAQTHIASDYAGDSAGRFHDRTYRIGEQLAWFPPPDKRSTQWSDGADPNHLPLVREACYATCPRCRADVCVVIEFENLVPKSVVTITRDDARPIGYQR